jgi:hypothetical protein
MISAFSRCATAVCSSPEVPWGCDQNSVVRTLLEKGSQHPDITEKRAVNRAASLTDDRSGVNIFSSALLANLKINQRNKSESRVGTRVGISSRDRSNIGAGRPPSFVLPKTFLTQAPLYLFATPAPSRAFKLKLLPPAIPISFSSPFTFSLI